MDLTCAKCGAVSTVPDQKIPLGRSYILCPSCEQRINIFKGLAEGATVENTVGLRFLRYDEDFHEEFCGPGEMWRVVQAITPCPDKGLHKSCELDNRGRCPNQRLILRLLRDRSLYKSCLYRKGRRIFAKPARTSVGAESLRDIMEIDEDKTYRIRI